MNAIGWRRQNLPWLFIAATTALLALGLSALDRGDELVGVSNTASRQMLWIVISIPVVLLTLLVPYQWLRRFALPIFLLTVMLLLIVFLMPMRHGSRRWIPLVLFDLQPSELAKLATIFALAAVLSHRDTFRSLPGLILPTLIAFVPMILVLKEPDLGTALVFLPVWFAMLFAAGARPRHLLAAGVCGACALPVLWTGMSAEQRSRVVAVFTQRDSGPTPQGDGYHLHQSKRMLVLGKTWGTGLEEIAAYDPSMSHLPAGRTDFIFCLLGQRHGLTGCLLTLALFGLLIWGGNVDCRSQPGAVWPAGRRGHYDFACHANRDQHRNDCRIDANHRPDLAADELRRFQPGFDPGRTGPGGEYRLETGK